MVSRSAVNDCAYATDPKRTSPTRTHAAASDALLIRALMTRLILDELSVAPALREVEGVEEIAERGHVHRYVRIVRADPGIRQVVAAARAHRAEMPVALDELVERHVIPIAVRDPATGRPGGQHQQRHPRPV